MPTANGLCYFLSYASISGTCQPGLIIFFGSANVNAGNSEFLHETSSDNCHCMFVPDGAATSRSFSTDTLSLIPGWSRTMWQNRPSAASTWVPSRRRVRQRRVLQWEAEGWKGRDETSRDETRTAERTLKKSQEQEISRKAGSAR